MASKALDQDPERDERSSAETQKTLRGVQMLASKLQKAVSSRHASRREMKLVDRFLSRQLTARVASILENIDLLGGNTSSFKIKEKLSRLYLTVMDIFNEFKDMEVKGYTSLVKLDGAVDRSRLASLVEVDSELSSIITNVDHMIASSVRRRKISDLELSELSQIFDDVSSLLELRRSILTGRI